jgi:hypothetical protein
MTCSLARLVRPILATISPVWKLDKVAFADHVEFNRLSAINTLISERKTLVTINAGRHIFPGLRNLGPFDHKLKKSRPTGQQAERPFSQGEFYASRLVPKFSVFSISVWTG